MKLVPWEQFAVLPSVSLFETLQKIDGLEGRPCIVVDESATCLGVVTQGDIRRAILAGLSVEDPVESCLKPFESILLGTEPASVGKKLTETKIDFLPALDARGAVKGVWIAQASGSSLDEEVPVLVMAGGRGSRLRPLTDKLPKPLIKLGEKTLIERAIEVCEKRGFSRFFISVGYQKAQIVRHLNTLKQSSRSTTFLTEDQPLGTAGPIGLVDDSDLTDLLVVNADVVHDVDLRELVRQHRDRGADLTMCVRAYSYSVPFGVVTLDGLSVKGVEEKPEVSMLVNAGIYVVGRAIVDSVQPNIQLDMPTLIESARLKGLKIDAFFIHEYWLDVGTPENLAVAQRDLENRRLPNHGSS